MLLLNCKKLAAAGPLAVNIDTAIAAQTCSTAPGDMLQVNITTVDLPS